MCEWIGVDEDLPQNDSKYKNCSIDVMCKLKNGTETKGFYTEHNGGKWYDHYGRHIEVVAWRSWGK